MFVDNHRGAQGAKEPGAKEPRSQGAKEPGAKEPGARSYFRCTWYF